MLYISLTQKNFEKKVDDMMVSGEMSCGNIISGKPINYKWTLEERYMVIVLDFMH